MSVAGTEFCSAPMDLSEIEKLITSQASGYSSRNIKVYVDNTDGAIDDVVLISGCTSKDPEEEVGRKLYNDVQDMVCLLYTSPSPRDS